MQIYISIVDDSKSDMLYLKERIEKWARDNNHTVEITTYPDGMCFVNAVKAESLPCNVVFLDILMPEKNGIQIADILNNECPQIYKVLYSSAIEYTSKGYIVNAVRYLLKNTRGLDDDIYECMEYIVKRINEDSAYYYDASSARTIIKPIPCNMIVSVCVSGNYAQINTIDGEHIKHRTTLKEVKERLPENFLLCNRNTIVNVRFIKQVRDHSVRMDDDTEFVISNSHSARFMELLSEVM